MRILLGNNHLNSLGGSETFTYTLAKAFVELGHSVDVVTLQPGIVSDMMEKNLGCRINKLHQEYDGVFVSHTSVVAALKRHLDLAGVYQICHGVIVPLEHPSPLGVKHIAITGEVQSFIKSKGYDAPIIFNPIDCKTFGLCDIIKEKPRVMFSLAHDDKFNDKLSRICDKLNISFKKRNKYTNPTVGVSEELRDSDLVVSLGRGCYEAMSSGKSVLVADSRPYQTPMMDGLIKLDNIESFMYNNCSGRKNGIDPTEDALLEEIHKYSVEDGINNRQFVEKHLNSHRIASQYLNLL